jgi:hypothetical protein
LTDRPTQVYVSYILCVIPKPRLSQMRTMCSPTHNAASITTGYPPANRPPSEPATQMPQAAFSACSPACSATAPRATADRLVPDQSNRTRDPMQIKSLATYLKTCVIFFPLQYLHFSPSNVCATQRRLTPLFFFFSFATVLYSFYGQRSSGISRCGPG